MTTPPVLQARSLPDIAADVLRVTCGHCRAAPAKACDCPEPGGLHVARYDRALRRGLISPQDFQVAMETVFVFTEATVIYAGEVPA